jgi:hypothetical protein
VSFNWIQFWHHQLPQVERVQSHTNETLPPHFRCQLQSQIVAYTSEFLTVNQVYYIPLLRFNYLIVTHRTQGILCSYLSTYNKGYDKGYIWVSRWKRCLGQGKEREKGHTASIPSRNLHVLNYPEVHLHSVLLDFYGGLASLCSYDWLNYWPLVINSTFSVYHLPRCWGLGLKVPTL